MYCCETTSISPNGLVSIRIRVADREEYGIEKKSKNKWVVTIFYISTKVSEVKTDTFSKMLSRCYISVYLLAILITLKDGSIFNIDIIFLFSYNHCFIPVALRGSTAWNFLKF